LRNLFRYILALTFTIYFSSNVSAQTKLIKGLVKNSSGSAVPGAHILIKNSQDYIVSFSYTDTKGRYSIKLPEAGNTSGLVIGVACIGYKKIQVPFSPDKDTYDFLIEEQAIDLQEVKIKNRPRITSKGDTVSYNVGSFSRAEDRSIGDVIRRLPGVSVADNGQISFNGKNIQNLYIQGDDLMDGRYGLATKVIAKDMIKTIDVIEHFQPINVLKDKVFTDEVAMNLILKDENSLNLAGQAVLGGGLPEQYDAALNLMMFNKKIKMLNSLKANNSGIDLGSDFAQLGTGLVNDVGNPKPRTLLALGTVGGPDLPKGNYYLNQSELVNINNLVTLKNDFKIKSNIQVFFDKNRLNYNSSLDNYLQGDTLKYNETQRTVNKPYSINTSFTLTANKNSYFLNNKLSLNVDGNRSTSFIDFNGKSFNQALKQKNMSFFNDFSFTPAMRNSKNIADVRWYLGYSYNPENLGIDAGLNPELLNEGLPYAGSIQHTKTPTFYNHITLAYRIVGESLIQQNYQVGAINEWQRFGSILNIRQTDNTVTDYSLDAGNNLNWRRNRVFANMEYSIKQGAWTAVVSLPIVGQSIRYQQEAYGLKENKNQFFINPAASVRLLLNAEDYISLNFNRKNSFGDIYNIYRGTVLTNYRNLFANSADLQEQITNSIAATYDFKRTITMFFAAARFNYRRVTAYTILANVLTDNIQRTELIPYKNDQSSIDFNVDLSKYIFVLNTTISANTVVRKTNYNQFINDTLYPFENLGLSMEFTVDSKFLDKITMTYKGRGFWNRSEQKQSNANAINNRTERFDQYLNFGYSPVNDLSLNLAGRHIYGSQSNVNYLFLDVRARYKFTKLHTDVELNITNIGNIKNYEVFSLSSNQYYVSRYEIRGRMGILKATFNL